MDFSSPTTVVIVVSFGTVGFCCVAASVFAVCKVLTEARREKARMSAHAKNQHARSMAVVKRQTITARTSIMARVESSHDDSQSEPGSEASGEGSDGDANDMARKRARLAQKHRMKAQASKRSTASDPMVLPDNKSYHYYLSFEKAHSRYKKTPERLAQELFDALQPQGFSGCKIDTDTDKQSLAKLRSSSTVIAMLHNEAFTDRCVMHWQVAKQDRIPIVFIVDRSRFFLDELQEEMEHIDPELLACKWIEYFDDSQAVCLEKTAQWLKTSLAAPRASAIPKKRSSVSGRRSSISGFSVNKKPTSVLPGQPDEDSSGSSSSEGVQVGAAHVIDEPEQAHYAKPTRLMKKIATRKKKNFRR